MKKITKSITMFIPEIIRLITNNKEWLFSGVGITIIIAIISTINTTKPNEQIITGYSTAYVDLANVENSQTSISTETPINTANQINGIEISADENSGAIVNGDNNIVVAGNDNSINVSNGNSVKQSNLSISSKVNPNHILDIQGSEKYSNYQGYSMVNVILQNRGDLAAAVSQFSINVTNYTVDKTPNFKFTKYVKDGLLYVDVYNNGWGVAEEYDFELTLYYYKGKTQYTLNKYISKPENFTTFMGKLDSDATANIFKIKSDYFDLTELFPERNINGDMNSNNEPFEFEPEPEPTLMDDYLYLNPKVLSDKYGTYYSVYADVRFSSNHCDYEGENNVQDKDYDTGTSLIKNAFISTVNYPTHATISSPDTIYATIVNENVVRHYPIERIVPVGGVDNFNIYVASDKSCTFDLALSIEYNFGETIVSENIPIKLTRRIDTRVYDNIYDGCEIDINKLKKKNVIYDLWDD